MLDRNHEIVKVSKYLLLEMSRDNTSITFRYAAFLR
jgi:hypothetical protein